jgi:hypothetical protein
VPESGSADGSGWLRRRPALVEPVWVGEPLDVVVRRSLLAGKEVTSLLGAWIHAICAESSPSGDQPDAAHPFSPIEGEPSIAADLLDANLGNAILQPDGTIRLVDREWSAVGPVSLTLAVYRSLFYFVHQQMMTGHAPFIGALATLREYTEELFAFTGLPCPHDAYERFERAESALQDLVGIPGAGEGVQTVAALSASAVGPRSLPFTELRAALEDLGRRHASDLAIASDLRADNDAMHQRLAALEAVAADAESQRSQLAGVVRDRDGTIDKLNAMVRERDAHIGALAAEADRLRGVWEAEVQRAEHLRVRLERIESRPIMRVYRRVRRLTAQATRTG